MAAKNDENSPRGRQSVTGTAFQGVPSLSMAMSGVGTVMPPPPEILLQAQLVSVLGNSLDGQLIEAISVPWRQIFKRVAADPNFLTHFTKSPRAFEEFIAAAYDLTGEWDEVILTPRSKDGGRDVIVIKHGFGSVRFLEQTKAYSPGRLVTHDAVRAMLGVLQTDANSSKGIITTTSDFAPGVLSGREFARFIPHRLETKNGQQLREWLLTLDKGKIS